MRASRALTFAVSSVFLLIGCSKNVRTYSTWASLGERPAKSISIPIEALPPLDAHPWGGTVSHHLLTDTQIDRWFFELAARRNVEQFYIICPSHWGLSTQTYSLTDGSWLLSKGQLASDQQRMKALAKKLGVSLEPTVFDHEHGISVLAPYIIKYFPNAKVLAIACQGEPPLDQPMAERLASALQPAFDKKGKEKNFLLVSTDFSHHGDLSATKEKDERSRAFFQFPSQSSWIVAGCDNRPGIYVLARLFTPEVQSAILFHCNSFDLTGQNKEDITSYFFSFFW